MARRHVQHHSPKSHRPKPPQPHPLRLHHSPPRQPHFPEALEPQQQLLLRPPPPPELGRLRRIQHISLSNNLIEGDLSPSLANCTNLLSLVVSYNRLRGALPSDLGSLSKLELFSISRNSFSGAIPDTLGNLSSLTRLYCGSNDLSGSLPASLGRLAKLELLAFGENVITGVIPPSVFNLSKITVFDLAANQFGGSLPSDLASLFPGLDFFSVGINMLEGSIPPSLSNATSLRYIHVGYNQLTGEVPSFMKLNKLTVLALSGNMLGRGGKDLSFVASLKNATNLVSLGLDGNGFGGELHPAFWNLSTAISRLFLSQNQISGTVPNDVGKYVELRDLRINMNRLVGVIPSSIGKLRNLQFLDLSSNGFSSRIPSSLGNLSLLIYMYLSYNNFGSFIPSSIGNCQKLLELNLTRNSLTGSLPKEVVSIPSLRSIDLSQNQLNSTLPAEIGSLKNLEYLNISNNRFVGNVPSSIGGCVRLEFLDLQGNSFQGNIPSSLSALRGLQVLDLSRNRFDGLVPEYLAEFSLLALNLSFNDLEGALPQGGMFKNAIVVSVAGNPNLCGGVPELRLSKCSLKRHKKSSLKIVIPTTLVVVLTVISDGALVFCCLKRRKPPPPSNPFDNSLMQVSYQTLSQATNGFSEDSLLGVGSYGSVYRGTLGEDRKPVAVKVLNLSQRGAVKSFAAECEALRNVRHRNLVKVITACSGFDLQGNDFKALVYEFMPNGSLDEWLHEDKRRGQTRRLGLVQMLSITIDVACAVDYLHQQCATPIIHCEIKPSNVLLDNDLVGCVGDFGLARFLVKATDSSSTHQQSSSLIRGTVGYTAPE
ncbi:putative receptor-like protein kinase At3g47110 [Salvia hispanica]|uniref:putative receptor-like protein kinase At3g47110 n=1 Tax=Salvia hispanica TaxID=49212 RepID=UPI0020095314|nr:putative receptor-like protein kinase At3g47110 [Salvia hispanica]